MLARVFQQLLDPRADLRGCAPGRLVLSAKAISSQIRP
jgi:hypothetical protein